MGALLFYIFESTLCLIILYLLFSMFFRADTLFRTNRLLLLGGTMCCMLLPFMQLDISENQLWQQPISAVRSVLIVDDKVDGVQAAGNFGMAISAMQDTEDNSASRTNADLHPMEIHFSWTKALGLLYLIGAGSTLLFFLLSTWRMWRLIHHYPKYNHDKYKLVICPEKVPSFSWGNTIVLSQEDYDKHADEILLHEQMHLRYCHTLDLLWMEMLIVLHWFNPVVWLLMRDLRELHEFEADNGVLTHGIDATQYQLLLVKKSVGTRLYSMANGFNHSKLKKRINMMLKKRTNSWARLKLLLFVPVAAATLMAFAQPEVKKTVEQAVKPESMGQDSICKDEFEQLEQFFALKWKDAAGDKQNMKEGNVHSLFVNVRNQAMLDNEALKDTDWNKNAEFIRVALTDILKKEYQKAKQAKRQYQQFVLIHYDRGSHIGAMTLYLETIKEVYSQLRKEIAAELGGISEAELDNVFPILVTFAEPKTFGKIPSRGVTAQLPIEVRLMRHNGAQPKTLKDISLKELEKEITDYKESIGEDYFLISFKANPQMEFGTVKEVKKVILEAMSKF